VMTEVQLRTDEGELLHRPTAREAFEYAEEHHEVWRISWTESSGDRVRLVRSHDLVTGPSAWVYDPMGRYLRMIGEEPDDASSEPSSSPPS
jgi:hypothetical protein